MTKLWLIPFLSFGILLFCMLFIYPWQHYNIKDKRNIYIGIVLVIYAVMFLMLITVLAIPLLNACGFGNVAEFILVRHARSFMRLLKAMIGLAITGSIILLAGYIFDILRVKRIDEAAKKKNEKAA